MKKYALLLSICFTTSLGKSQCNALYSFGAYFETVNFINQSSVSNAHYFWNFGDGTGSNYPNPVHKFPANGHYLVTLFAKDTVSNCSDYYEYWVHVTMNSSDTCQPDVNDSLVLYNGQYYVTEINNSVDCGIYYDVDFGSGLNFPPGNWGIVGYWAHARFITRLQFYFVDTANNYVLTKEAYKSCPFKYDSGKNYGDCSANFEFTVVSEDSIGQRILFKAMNKDASYEWAVMGFGNPIISTNDTVSCYYPFNPNDLWHVQLITTEPNGCKDTLMQVILVRGEVTTVAIVDEIISNYEFSVYPNPFTEGISITMDKMENKPFTIKVYNALGSLVYQDQFKNSIKLNTEGWQPGMYIIQTTNDHYTITKKVIKQ